MTLRSIQALRALAALLVVSLHCLQMWAERVDATAPGVAWGNGAAGVDIFFVISGLVMGLSTQQQIGRHGSGTTFIWNRIVRIVPLYWLLTTLKLAAVLAFAGLALRSETDFGYVLSSYLFLPVMDHAGDFRPLLPVGWTLTFEFMFYLIFASALFERVKPLAILIPILTGVAFLGLMRTGAWPIWTVIFDPIVLEFLFGVVLAEALSAGWKLRVPAAICAVSLGTILLLFCVPNSGALRVIVWGIPALAIVAGAVSLERELAPLIPKWLLATGDASYSLYLSHGLVLPMVGVVVAYFRWAGIFAQAGTIGGSMIVCALVAVLLHRWVERPMLTKMRGWLPGGGSARTKVSAVGTSKGLQALSTPARPNS